MTEKTPTHTLINCFNDAVILFKKETENNNVSFFEANQTALELFNRTKEEFLSLSFNDIFDKVTYGRILEARDLSKISEGLCLNKNGISFPVEFYSNCTSSDENIYILVIKDISIKRQYEEQLSRYIQELHENKDLMERNGYELVLLNVKLEESEEQLKALNASKDKFFSIIAHDLKSPFTSFLGLTELLSEDFDDMELGEIKQLILELNKSATNFYSLLENLLSWSIVQTGRMDFKPDIISPKGIVENIQNLFESSTLQKKITLTSEILSEKSIYADKNMTETVLRNLVSNAIKFTGENGIIAIKINDTDNNMLEFSVQDSGMGMSAENMAKLFRIDKHHTTLGTKNEKGTGLGLILCKELVEINGGKITVDSEMGVGTKFSFCLPLKKPVNSEP